MTGSSPRDDGARASKNADDRLGASSLLSWHAARLRARAAVTPLPTQSVAVGRAEGRVLAGPVIVRSPLPGFHTAAMDGYAVRGPGPWLVQGRTLAGERPAEWLAVGHAREVATGARIPECTDAVVPYERARRCGELLNGVIGARHIRPAGEEISVGEIACEAGVVMTPVRLGLLAALGLDAVEVVARPRFAAVVTGDEVVRSGTPEAGHVRDAIGPMLPGMASYAGGRLVTLDYVADYRTALVEAIERCDADVLLVSGSSSVGRADYLRAAMEGLGAEPVVLGVACRPGHTQSLWRCSDGRTVIGLPGNPLAAVIAFLTLAMPCSSALLGRELPELACVAAGDLHSHPTATRLCPVRVTPHGVRPTGHDGSAMLRGLAGADAIAVVPPACGAEAAVEVMPLPWRGGSCIDGAVPLPSDLPQTSPEVTRPQPQNPRPELSGRPGE